MAPGRPGLDRPVEAWPTRAGPGALAEHVFGPLADLPIGVTDGLAEGALHLVAFKSIVEPGQCDHRPPSDCRLVPQGTEHRGQAVGLTKGSERSYSCLTAQRVTVARSHGAEGVEL